MAAVVNLNSDLARMVADPSFREFVQRCHHRNLFQILGVSRRETVHSSFLCWLFGQIDSRRVQSAMIKGLLRAIYASDRRAVHDAATRTLPEGLDDPLKIDFFSVECVTAETEKITGNEKRRIDLVIECRGSDQSSFTVIVENKVKAFEHCDQTSAYYKWATNFWPDRHARGELIFVYLTAEPIAKNHDSTLASDSHFTTITYQEIYDHCLRPALSELEEECRTREALFLSEYIRNLEINFDERRGRGQIMARSRDEIELCKRFVKEYGDVILHIVQAAEPTSDLAARVERVVRARVRNTYDVDPEQLVEAGLLHITDQLVFCYSKEFRGDKATLEQDPSDGSIRYRWNDQLFPTINKLGRAIMEQIYRRKDVSMAAWGKFFVNSLDGKTLEDLRSEFLKMNRNENTPLVTED